MFHISHWELTNNVYQAFLFAMFKYGDINTSVWRFVMEQEVGCRQMDIIVVGPTKVIIYELKKVSNIEDMEQSAIQALMQVETHKYYGSGTNY